MSYKPKVLTLSEGGTSVNSFTAYAVLCGGTTSTGALQSIASVGTLGQVLTSNGVSLLPSFQTAPAGSGFGFVLYGTSDGQSPVDSTTYYIRQGIVFTTAQSASTRIYSPISGTISNAYLYFSCTAGTSEAVSFYIRLNNTTDTLISNAVTMNTSTGSFSNTTMNIAIAAGDFIEFKFVTPAWATNPTFLRLSISAYLS